MDAWLQKHATGEDPIRLPSFTPSTKATHYSMKGGAYGKMRIPDKLATSFLKAVATEFGAGRPMYWAEKRTTPVFRLFIDIDPKAQDVPMLQVAAKLHEDVLNSFVTDEAAKALVSLSTDQGKGGCHITWPNVFVDTSIAMAMREKWIQTCKGTWSLDTKDAWDEIIDACVYTTNGLRMLGCQKGVNKHHVYEPHVILDGRNEPEAVSKEEYAKNPYFYFEMASIRAPEAETTTHKLTCGTSKPSRKRKSIDYTQVDICQNIETLFDAMRQVLPSFYSGCKLTVTRQGISKGLPFWHVRCSSKFCINVNREHTSSNVWFHVTPCEVRQRCFSRKPTLKGRSFCLCKDFRSPIMPFTKGWRERLSSL